MAYEITTRILEKQPTAACQAELPLDRVGPWLAEAYALVWQFLETIHRPPVGPPYARYAFEDGHMRVEAGFPVASGVRGDEVVHAATLPGGLAAVTTHVGPYEGLEDAYHAVADWLADHGYEQTGPHWEVYFTDPAQEPDSSRWRTDLLVPYAYADRTEKAGTP